ncbi:hypothetical protein HanOQP8_Chr16g0607621 [Helianthus annuus]|nr:hypothetical protein HanOQP8_Chr16g0607621 [Helianthus annuus]
MLAMDFRDWCKNECVRLLGTKDTPICQMLVRLGVLCISKARNYIFYDLFLPFSLLPYNIYFCYFDLL